MSIERNVDGQASQKDTESERCRGAAQAAVLPKIPPELLDQLVKGPMTRESIQDASRAFKRALIERAMGPEMTHHLG